jgi:predicted HTH transcriptional regulator
MNLSTEDLQQAIRLGEDSRFEFKEVRFAGNKMQEPRRDRLAKELSAMANAAGGYLVLGIKDTNREILGIPFDRLDLVEDTIRQVAQDSITPALPINIYRHELETDDGGTKAVMVAEADKGLYVHATREGYFRRTGSGAYPMDSLFLARLNQERSLAGIKRFEQLPVPETTIADLDERLWQPFVSDLEEDSQTALIKRNLLIPNEDGEATASVAGVLMASQAPHKKLPNTFIQAVRYRGVDQDSHHQVDARQITGPLHHQVADALSFFRLHNQIGATKEVARRDQPQFSERAFFEAIVNAVAHRDYSISHSKIRLFIFDDRLEVYSPGNLINSMSLDSLGVRTATRNELLTNLLAECPLPGDSGEKIGRSHLMERRGDGIQIIKRETKSLSGKDPVFELFDEAELRVTIPAAPLPNSQ